MAARAKPGDVLGVTSKTGRIYLHYLGKHTDYGDAVVVCPATYDDPPQIGSQLFIDGYVAFYPAVAAVARGLAQVVGHVPPGGLPAQLRRPGARVGRDVRTWVIEQPSGETVRETLSADELRFPIAVIWNHELLVQRVAEGWRPEMEGSSE
jgi:hypothetical protein